MLETLTWYPYYAMGSACCLVRGFSSLSRECLMSVALRRILLSTILLTFMGCGPTDPSINANPGESNNSTNNGSNNSSDNNKQSGNNTGNMENSMSSGNNQTPGNNQAPENNQSPEPDMRPEIIDGADITVATFNVKRLFDTRCDSGRCESGDFEEAPSELALKSKVERIQRAIETLGADVIVFQEIEKEELLDRITENVRSEYPTRVFGETSFSASLDIAVIARGSLIKTLEHRDDRLQLDNGTTDRFARELLEVHVDIDGARVIVFGAHFISQRDSSADSRRRGEAKRTGELASAALAANPEALVVVAGDLNDVPGSDTIDLLDDAGLRITSAELDSNVEYTHVYAGNRQILDHVLFYDTDHTDLGYDGVRAVRDQGAQTFGGSDHAAAMGTFRVAQ